MAYGNRSDPRVHFCLAISVRTPTLPRKLLPPRHGWHFEKLAIFTFVKWEQTNKLHWHIQVEMKISHLRKRVFVYMSDNGKFSKFTASKSRFTQQHPCKLRLPYHRKLHFFRNRATSYFHSVMNVFALKSEKQCRGHIRMRRTWTANRKMRNHMRMRVEALRMRFKNVNKRTFFLNGQNICFFGNHHATKRIIGMYNFFQKPVTSYFHWVIHVSYVKALQSEKQYRGHIRMRRTWPWPWREIYCACELRFCACAPKCKQTHGFF